MSVAVKVERIESGEWKFIPHRHVSNKTDHSYTLKGKTLAQPTVGSTQLSTSDRKERNYRYYIATPYSVALKVNGKMVMVEVQTNFLSDGNSGFAAIPEFGWFSCADAWVVHDWLYASQPTIDGLKITQEIADQTMLAILDYRDRAFEELGTRVAMKLAASQFASSWGISGQRGPEFLVLP